MHTLELIVLLIAALATGGLMVNWVGLARAMAPLSPSTYIEFHQSTNRTFDPYIPIVVIGAIAGGIALAVASGIHTASGQLSAFGVVCYVAVIAIGVPTCVRMNKQVACWSIGNPPGDWAAVRTRWIRFHVIRTLFSVPAFALYAAAMILRTA
ncbi:MAG: DUF1772 domain-containing protein [Acidobacteriaceae bacterium]|nr:DUF1772 domain-containing protein [Acidobacteriaceae bacterium]